MSEALAAVRRSRITAIAGSILGTQVATSGLGFLYWTIAARGLPTATVGHLGTATAAAQLLSTFGAFGCGTLLISRLGSSTRAEQRRLLVTSMIVGSLLSGLLAYVFGIVAWLTIPSFSFLIPTGSTFWLLTATSAFTALGEVFDQAMLVLGKPTTQVLRNVVASGLKVLLLGLVVLAGRTGVSWGLAVWVLGQAAGCLLAVRAAWRLTRTTARVTLPDIRGTIRRYRAEAANHHWTNVALSAPTVLQPVIIAAAVPAHANAVFTTVRLVSTFAFTAPYSLAMALFAASAADPEAHKARARSVFKISLLLSLALYAVLFVAAPLILDIFGHQYAAAGVGYLRIIGLACPLLVFKDQFIAGMRAGRKLKSALPYVFASTALEIAATLAGAVVGDLTGALVGWLVALALGAVWVQVFGGRARPGGAHRYPGPRQPAHAESLAFAAATAPASAGVPQ